MTLTAQIIPAQPVAAQTLNATLNQQVCQINLYAKNIWVPVTPAGSIPTAPPAYEEIQTIFIDLFVNDTLLIGGVLARCGVGIVQNTYFGFVGEIAIEDTEGDTDYPVMSQLGSRYQLTYWWNQG
jgi:hypothetical protein